VDFASPIGGGKFKQVVKDIVHAEGAPIRQIEARKTKEEERLKLFQDFLSKFKKLQEIYKELENLRKFRELKAEWPAKDLLDVGIDKDFAEPGEYQLQIDQIAGRHSMISDGYESPDDEIGIGYFTYDLPDGDSKSVYIGPSNNTLKGIVRAINSERPLGLQASLINDGSGSDRSWRVVVAAKNTGVDNDIIYPYFYFLDGDFRFYVDDERPAQNALLQFNGFEIESQANRFELLPGVTLELLQGKEDFEFTLNIVPDYAKISAKIKALVDALNAILEFINKQNKLDAHSDTSRTLGGDTTLMTAESRIRNWVFEQFNVGNDWEDEEWFMRLSEVGVRFEKTGLLSFDENKFKKQLMANFDQVANLFSGYGNFIWKIKEMTENFIITDTGVLGGRERGIRDRIKIMDQDITRKEMNLQKREATLRRQFSQLEGLMNSMQGQQQYLQQSFGSPGLLAGAI